MVAKTADKLFDSLIPVMKRYGVSCSSFEFYELVNLHFHAAESVVYDKVHRGMWQSLPRQFELLTDDCADAAPRGKLRVLDIGCGTGLGAEQFLKTRLGSRTYEIHLLDTSKEMLGIAVRRSRRWTVDVKSFCGKISDLPTSQKFEVILASSVLHHIADLESFMNEIAKRQSAGGLLFHFQDPNADYVDDLEHRSRLAEHELARASLSRMSLVRRLTPGRIYKRLTRNVSGRPKDYIGATNDSLMRLGIIKRDMSASDIWQVADIRLSQITKGISLQGLRAMLPSYELVSCRSYEFFGDLQPLEQFRVREDQLIGNRSMTGGQLAGAWKFAYRE